MRVLMMVLAAAFLSGVLLALGGCAVGGAGIAPTGDFGTVRVNVAWPPTGTRMIPAVTDEFQITVTGAGIVAPVTGTITRPDTTLDLVVPAGFGRSLKAEALDAAGVHVTGGWARNFPVAPGRLTSVTVPLTDVDEPENEDWATAPTYAVPDAFLRPGGVVWPDRQDFSDRRKFTLLAGQQYVIDVTPTEGTGTVIATVKRFAAADPADGEDMLANSALGIGQSLVYSVQPAQTTVYGVQIDRVGEAVHYQLTVYKGAIAGAGSVSATIE